MRPPLSGLTRMGLGEFPEKMRRAFIAALRRSLDDPPAFWDQAALDRGRRALAALERKERERKERERNK